MSALDWLAALPVAHAQGRPMGLTSVCSAHPDVIAAALAEAAATNQPACIEATCNQVNQTGGYTGMKPADFCTLVHGIAATQGVDPQNIVLGGDHLGPNPWRHLPSSDAMARAETMTYAYAAAGFGKIHADASMACADDPSPLPAATIAARAARLVAAAEAGARAGGHPPPLYIIGTEVPVPGGATEALDTLTPTTPQDAADTLSLHKDLFATHGLTDAFDRVIAMVVQPGVEFGHSDVIPYDPAMAKPLTDWRRSQTVLFEAHSTDYQSATALAALVRDGCGILKVGPGLTFALRETLYALSHIAGHLTTDAPNLPRVMEQIMTDDPSHWNAYYHGDDTRMLRHFSYSDRIRYYWTTPTAQSAVETLMTTLGTKPIPAPLRSQYLPHLADTNPTAPALIQTAIRRALAPYSAACQP